MFYYAYLFLDLPCLIEKKAYLCIPKTKNKGNITNEKIVYGDGCLAVWRGAFRTNEGR